MENKLNLKNIIIFAIILLVFAGLYVVIDRLTHNEEDNEIVFLKNYKVNEYIPTYVSDESMAEIYLNHYVYIMHSDIEKAYSLLDDEYKNKKFGDITNFSNYVNSLNYSAYKLDSFYLNEKKGYNIFKIYDTNGNIFIFKTTGVMQYTIYLDDYTVEI